MANRVSCLWISNTGGSAASPARKSSQRISIQLIGKRFDSFMAGLRTIPAGAILSPARTLQLFLYFLLWVSLPVAPMRTLSDRTLPVRVNALSCRDAHGLGRREMLMLSGAMGQKVSGQQASVRLHPEKG